MQIIYSTFIQNQQTPQDDDRKRCRCTDTNAIGLETTKPIFVIQFYFPFTGEETLFTVFSKENPAGSTFY